MSAKSKAANRRNAKRSTGPRTAEGKAQSSQNAITHGLTARRPLLPDEDPEQYDQLRRGLTESFAPRGALETEFVDTLVGLFWRLRRIPELERALFVWMGYVRAREYDSKQALRRVFTDPRSFFAMDDEELPPLEEHLIQRMGRTIEGLLTTDVQGKLTRYEIALRRQLSQVWKELREVQAERRQREKPSPQAQISAAERSHVLEVVDHLPRSDEPSSVVNNAESAIGAPSNSNSGVPATSERPEGQQPARVSGVAEEPDQHRPWWTVKGAYG